MFAPHHMVDPRLERYFKGVAVLLWNPAPVRKAGEKPVMGGDKKRRWRFFKV
jgi:hypothetical protein